MRLASCCREEYHLLRPAVSAVAYSAEACADASTGAVASPLLKERVMRQVRAEAARRTQPRVWPAYSAAAACIAIVAVLSTLLLNARLNREHAQRATQAQTVADLTAPDAKRYFFTGGEVLSRDGRLYLAMHALAAPPPGRVYQAWTLRKGATSMAPSITFTPTQSGVAVLRLPVSAMATAAVAVSVEPEGGSKEPTTKPIVVVRI
jgi:anti-sigma-K factor RskA